MYIYIGILVYLYALYRADEGSKSFLVKRFWTENEFYLLIFYTGHYLIFSLVFLSVVENFRKCLKIFINRKIIMSKILDLHQIYTLYRTTKLTFLPNEMSKNLYHFFLQFINILKFVPHSHLHGDSFGFYVLYRTSLRIVGVL